jgi:RNA polymerase sigma factor (sigma-70 family)
MDEVWRINDFDVPLVEILRVVNRVCRGNGWRYVDDVYAEVLLRVFRKHATDPGYFKEKPGVLGFCFRAARSALLQTLRADKRIEFRDPRDVPEPPRVDSDDQELKELLADSERAASLLDDAGPRVREAFRLRCKEMSNRDVAYELGTTEGNATKYYKKALQLLKRKLDIR